MLSTINPSELDRIGTIRTGSGTYANGREPLTYTDTYTNVRSKKLAPLRSQGGEAIESNQEVFIEGNSWLIRKENRVIVPMNMVYVVDGKIHHIVNVRDYQGSRTMIVLDTEYRDNE